MAQSSKHSQQKTKSSFKKTSKHPPQAPKSSAPDNSHFHSHPPTQPQSQSQEQARARAQAEADLQARAREAATHSPLSSWAYQTENSHLTLYEKLEKDRWECGGGYGSGSGSGIGEARL